MSEGSITASVSGDKIVVRSNYNAYQAVTAANDGRFINAGIFSKPSKTWRFPALPSTAHEIFVRHTDVGYDVECDRAFVELCAKHADAIAARVHKNADELPEIPGDWCSCDARQPGDDEKGENPFYCVNCNRPLGSWAHQKQAFHWAIDQTGAGLSVGMGGGKSKLGVAILERREAKRVLILCPNNVVPVWPKEFAKHGSQPWRVWAGEVIGRSGKPKKKPSTAERATAIDDFLSRSHGAAAVVVNYEAAWQGKLGEALLSRRWDAIVLDESHRIKAPGGAASKFCARLREVTDFRLALTGTLQPHSPLDVYAQARFLDPGVFGTNFSKFRNRYAIMREIYNAAQGRHVPVVDGFQREDELAQKIGELFYVISQEELDEALGLAVPTEYDRPVQISDKARKTYNDVWNQFVVDFGDQGEVFADNALTRILRVQQITSGHVGAKDDFDETHVVEIDDAKAKALASVLEDMPQHNGEVAPVVVFCRFKHDLKKIREVALAAGRRYGELSGDDKGGMKDDATMRDDVDVLGVQMQAGGVGIDLTRAAHCVFYSIGHSLGDYLQARKRVHRPGQTRHVTIVHLVATDTIDEMVYAALTQRKAVVDAVLAAAKAA